MAEVEVFAFHLEAVGEVADLLVFGVHRGGKTLGDGVQRNAAFRTLGTGERRDDRAEFERDRVGEHRLGGGAGAEQALGAGIFFDQRDAGGFPGGFVEEVDGDGVNREEAAGRAIFRTHVGDGRAVGERQPIEAGAVKFDEFADHAFFAQHLGNREHQIGGGDAFPELAAELEADDFRQQHGLRLAEHGGFRLDAADAPAENGDAIDHGGVRIGADHGVGIGDFHRHGFSARRLEFFLPGPDGLGQIFKIDLMADAGAGRHDREIGEGVLAPFQEGVAFAIALIFERDILLQRGFRAEIVDDHRMVDDEIDGHQRVDLFRIAAEMGDAVAHRGEIDHGRNAGKILHKLYFCRRRDGRCRRASRRDRPRPERP